LVQIYI